MKTIWAYYIIAVFSCDLLFVSPASAGHDEPRLIIIGNSLSTTHESWPNLLREIAPRWNIHVMAQNGRTIRDFSIPRDLWTTGNTDETVIYFLGSNDILQLNDVAHTKYRLQSHIAFLLERNFKVLLIMPPIFALDEDRFGASIASHRALFESFRSSDPNLWVYDIDHVWDSAETRDGIHPTQSLSMRIATAINWVLALNIR